MRDSLTTRLAVFLFLAAVCVLLAPHAAAQGCAACYSDAAAAGAQGRAALRHGILVLLFPTLSFFGGIFAVLYRRRNLSRSDTSLS